MASQPYMPSISAPSSIPKHLNFVRDPLKHNTVALKIANDDRVRHNLAIALFPLQRQTLT